MESLEFTVDKVKCQGCAANIKNGIGAMAGVSEVTVDVPTGKVEITGEGLSRQTLSAKLTELGYPEK